MTSDPNERAAKPHPESDPTVEEYLKAEEEFLAESIERAARRNTTSPTEQPFRLRTR